MKAFVLAATSFLSISLPVASIAKTPDYSCPRGQVLVQEEGVHWCCYTYVVVDHDRVPMERVSCFD